MLRSLLQQVKYTRLGTKAAQHNTVRKHTSRALASAVKNRTQDSFNPYFSCLSFLSISLLCSCAVAEAEAETAPMPIITRKEVSQHRSKEVGIWVIYKDGVYDITKFLANHPGGKDKIMLAAGGDVEPFWNIYRQHLNSPLPMELLKAMRIGTLHPADLAAMEAERSKSSQGDAGNPYRHDPVLSPVMQFYQRQPINAEPPGSLLTDHWLTPVDIWFVRNHHPVPHVDVANYQLDIVLASDLLAKKRDPTAASDELESTPLQSLDWKALKERYPEHSVVTSLQCGGNRRQAMSNIEKTNGSSWDISAISTAKWTGIKLRDVLESMGITEDIVFGNAGLQTGMNRIQHVHFVSADGLEASIPIRKALSRYGDVLLAYKMNDEPLAPKHGFPVRAVVPGHVGVRNVKWLTKIRLSSEEAYGTWQRGMAYKGFGPSVKSLDGIDVEAIPSLQEQPVQSAITLPAGTTKAVAGEPLTVKGYAYAGGGRGIVRVDVSADGGKSWRTADLLDGSRQPLDRAWAWTFWECDIPVPNNSAGQSLQLICKATDASYNVQPDSVQGIWNLRGINNNSWHRINIDIAEPEPEEEE